MCHLVTVVANWDIIIRQFQLSASPTTRQMRVLRSLFFFWICFGIGQGQLSQKAQKFQRNSEEDLLTLSTTEDSFFDFGLDSSDTIVAGL